MHSQEICDLHMHAKFCSYSRDFSPLKPIHMLVQLRNSDLKELLEHNLFLSQSILYTQNRPMQRYGVKLGKTDFPYIVKSTPPQKKKKKTVCAFRD